MAVTKGGLYLATFIDALDASNLGIDFSLTTHKVALYTNSLAPNFDTDNAYSATNEVSGSGNYSAGGITLSGLSPTLTVSPSGTIKYNTSNVVWAASTTITSAVCGIFYADALTNNDLLFLTYFGGAFSCTAGSFTITTPAAGWWTIANP